MHPRLKLLGISSCISKSSLAWITFQESIPQFLKTKQGKGPFPMRGEKTKHLSKPSLDNCLYLCREIPTDTTALVSSSEGRWSWSPWPLPRQLLGLSHTRGISGHNRHLVLHTQQFPLQCSPLELFQAGPRARYCSSRDITSLGEMHRAIQHQNRHAKPWLS